MQSEQNGGLTGGGGWWWGRSPGNAPISGGWRERTQRGQSGDKTGIQPRTRCVWGGLISTQQVMFTRQSEVEM